MLRWVWSHPTRGWGGPSGLIVNQFVIICILTKLAKHIYDVFLLTIEPVDGDWLHNSDEKDWESSNERIEYVQQIMPTLNRKWENANKDEISVS